MTGYTLIRSNRKTIAIYIRDGRVEVRAPRRASDKEIRAFVVSKEKWIAGKMAASKERLEKREGFSLDYGSLVRFMGSRYPIAARPGNKAGFDGENFFMPSDMAPEHIKSACAFTYRLLAKSVMKEKVAHFAGLMSLSPASVRITGAKTRWGSCSAKKSLNFSWRLMMADEDVIDYIAVHELAHIKEMNHSARFWAVVEGVLPDYREREKKLKELQKKLSEEDWGR